MSLDAQCSSIFPSGVFVSPGKHHFTFKQYYGNKINACSCVSRRLMGLRCWQYCSTLVMDGIVRDHNAWWNMQRRKKCSRWMGYNLSWTNNWKSWKYLRRKARLHENNCEKARETDWQDYEKRAAWGGNCLKPRVKQCFDKLFFLDTFHFNTTYKVVLTTKRILKSSSKLKNLTNTF